MDVKKVKVNMIGRLHHDYTVNYRRVAKPLTSHIM